MMRFGHCARHAREAVLQPRHASHLISFSGETSRREQNDVDELQVDRMLLNSKDWPKVDALPVPLVESSTGTCRQSGILSTRQISSIACTATLSDGRKIRTAIRVAR